MHTTLAGGQKVLPQLITRALLLYSNGFANKLNPSNVSLNDDIFTHCQKKKNDTPAKVTLFSAKLPDQFQIANKLLDDSPTTSVL